jgi:2-hydroxy-3-oxopropionate reductase
MTPAAAGFIGLGVMGLPMARNLMGTGVGLTVHSRSPEPVDALVADGATRASSPAEVAAATGATILMLPDDAAVADVVEGPGGVLEGAAPGHLLVDMSTVSPERARRNAERMREAGGSALDAPVSGGDVGARDGTLSIMVGGSAADFERARPIFDAVGATIVHVGDAGAGQVVKACNQIVVALTIEAVAEALVLGSRCGVDPATIVRVLSGGLAGSRVLEVRGPNMLAHDFRPGFAIDLHHKDLGIALGTARDHGVSLPSTALVDQMLASMRTAGHGGQDHSALLTHLEGLAQHTIGEDA